MNVVESGIAEAGGVEAGAVEGRRRGGLRRGVEAGVDGGVGSTDAFSREPRSELGLRTREGTEATRSAHKEFLYFQLPNDGGTR